MLLAVLVVMEGSISSLGVAGATVGVTTSSSSDVEEEKLDEISCNTIGEYSSAESEFLASS